MRVWGLRFEVWGLGLKVLNRVGAGALRHARGRWVQLRETEREMNRARRREGRREREGEGGRERKGEREREGGGKDASFPRKLGVLTSHVTSQPATTFHLGQLPLKARTLSQ